MPYTLRPWTDSDTGVDREISQAIYPEYQRDPRHPAWFPAGQLGAPAEALIRYVVEDEAHARPVAYAAMWELRPGRYRFDLAVRPECQRQGVGTLILARLIDDAQARRATGLQARVRDDQPHALTFAMRHGFRESHRMGAYQRDFRPSDAEMYARAADQLRGAGVSVCTLAEARLQDPDCVRAFHELYCAAREGWPDPDPDPAGSNDLPLSRVARWLDEVEMPDAFFIAKCGDVYMGFSSIFNLGTAVHPRFRHRGIATGLKAISIADAQRRGWHGQTTGSANAEMQKVLERLGYRRLWSEVRLLRPLE